MHGSIRNKKKKPPNDKQNIPLRKKKPSLNTNERTEYVSAHVITSL
jgi:hypothetical protein